MSIINMSKRQADLLAVGSDDVGPFMQAPTAEKKDLEAPKAGNNVVPHELKLDDSRMIPKMKNYINAQRLLVGTAHTEQRIIELNGASSINRGPEGVFQSSRLHFDMLLGRDERVFPSDYLNYDATDMY